MKRIKSLRGVELYEDTGGQEVVGIRVYYTPPREKRSRAHYEIIGPSVRRNGRNVTISKARRRLEALRREIRQAKRRGDTWLPPKKQAEANLLKKQQEQDARKDLLFENTVKRFLGQYGESYTRPKVVQQIFDNFLGRFFEGRYLDEVNRQDIWQYRQERRNATGAFEGCRKGGLRPVETDLSKLSALYSFLIYDEERQGISNPCARPAGFRDPRKRLKGEVYKPQRKPVVPSRDALWAILDAVPTNDTHFGKKHAGLQYRALFKLLFYTGARPESEACALTHGDVILPDPKVKGFDGGQRLGQVTFRDTKTAGGDRTLPLHPEAVADLRAIMQDRPSSPAAVERWKTLPIFRQRKTAKPMTKDTYRKVWISTLEAVAADHPDTAGMIVRDFRKTFRTYLTNAKQPEPRIQYLMGHSRGVSGDYDAPPWDELEKAILTLSLRPSSERNVDYTVDRSKSGAKQRAVESA